MPTGMSFKAIPGGSRHDHDHGHDRGPTEGEKKDEAARSPLRQGPDSVRDSRYLSTPFRYGGGVAGALGALSAGGAARSFIRRGHG